METTERRGRGIRDITDTLYRQDALRDLALESRVRTRRELRNLARDALIFVGGVWVFTYVMLRVCE